VGHFLFLDFDGAEVISETTGNNILSEKQLLAEKLLADQTYGSAIFVVFWLVLSFRERKKFYKILASGLFFKHS